MTAKRVTQLRNQRNSQSKPESRRLGNSNSGMNAILLPHVPSQVSMATVSIGKNLNSPMATKSHFKLQMSQGDKIRQRRPQVNLRQHRKTLALQSNNEVSPNAFSTELRQTEQASPSPQRQNQHQSMSEKKIMLVLQSAVAKMDAEEILPDEIMPAQQVNFDLKDKQSVTQESQVTKFDQVDEEATLTVNNTINSTEGIQFQKEQDDIEELQNSVDTNENIINDQMADGSAKHFSVLQVILKNKLARASSLKALQLYQEQQVMQLEQQEADWAPYREKSCVSHLGGKNQDAYAQNKSGSGFMLNRLRNKHKINNNLSLPHEVIAERSEAHSYMKTMASPHQQNVAKTQSGNVPLDYRNSREKISRESREASPKDNVQQNTSTHNTITSGTNSTNPYQHTFNKGFPIGTNEANCTCTNSHHSSKHDENERSESPKQNHIRNPVNQVQTRTVKMRLGRQIHASSSALQKLCIGQPAQQQLQSYSQDRLPDSNSGQELHRNFSFVLKKAGFGRGQPTMFYVQENQPEKNFLIMGQSKGKRQPQSSPSFPAQGLGAQQRNNSQVLSHQQLPNVRNLSQFSGVGAQTTSSQQYKLRTRLRRQLLQQQQQTNEQQLPEVSEYTCLDDGSARKQTYSPLGKNSTVLYMDSARSISSSKRNIAENVVLPQQFNQHQSAAKEETPASQRKNETSALSTLKPESIGNYRKKSPKINILLQLFNGKATAEDQSVNEVYKASETQGGSSSQQQLDGMQRNLLAPLNHQKSQSILKSSENESRNSGGQILQSSNSVLVQPVGGSSSLIGPVMIGVKSPLVSTIPRLPLRYLDAERRSDSREFIMHQQKSSSSKNTSKVLATKEKHELRMLALNKDFIGVVGDKNQSSQPSKRSQENTSQKVPTTDGNTSSLEFVQTRQTDNTQSGIPRQSSSQRTKVYSIQRPQMGPDAEYEDIE